MASKREQVLAALHARLDLGLSATVRRNEALPERVPADGLVIVRDGDPGEPDVTLNSAERVLQPSRRARTARDPADGRWRGGARRARPADRRSACVRPVARRLGREPVLGPPEIGTLAIEGAAPILTARLTLTVEYLVSDPLAA